MSAGIAGAIVATSTIESKTYAEFIATKQGAYGVTWLTGKQWVTTEHACFWLALIFLAASVLWSDCVWDWLVNGQGQCGLPKT